MFGIIYIVLSLLAGKELAEILLFTGKNAQEAGSRNGQHKACLLYTSPSPRDS